MSEAIVVALIGLSGSVIGSILGILASSKLIRYRIEQLEKKVDKHNTVVERTYHLEEDVGLLNERMKVANHRIDDLENGK